MNRYTLEALRRKVPDRQFFEDMAGNVAGLPEMALTMGTGLAAQAGTGLGVGAGMAKQWLKGEKPDLEAATDTIEDNTGKFTFAPRSQEGQNVAEGLGTVMEPLDRGMKAAGQKVSDVTGSPALGAATYAGLNVLDPDLLAPGAAKIAALRAGSKIAREGAKGAVPMGEALSHIPKGQRGAYTTEDLAGIEEGPLFKSTVQTAIENMKPQEAKGVPGRQMLSVLKNRGAKPEEMKWAGLERFLDTDEKVSPQEVLDYMNAAGPDIKQIPRGFAKKTPISPYGTDAPAVAEPNMLPQKFDYELREQVDEEMPAEYEEREYHIMRDGDGDEIGRFDSAEEANDAIDENVIEHYMSSPEDALGEEADLDEGFYDYSYRERRNLAAQWAADDPAGIRDNYSTDVISEPDEYNATNEDARTARFNELREAHPDPDNEPPDPMRSRPLKWTTTGTPESQNLRHPDFPATRENLGENQTIFTREGRYGRGSPVDAYAERMKAKYGEQWSTQMTPNEQRGMAQLQALVDAPDKYATRDFRGTEFVPHEHWDEPNVLSFSQMRTGLQHAGQPAFEMTVTQADPFQPHDKRIYDPEGAAAARAEWTPKNEAYVAAKLARDQELVGMKPMLGALIDELTPLAPAIGDGSTGSDHIAYRNYIQNNMEDSAGGDVANYTHQGMQRLKEYIEGEVRRGRIDGTVGGSMLGRVKEELEKVKDLRDRPLDVEHPGDDPGNPAGTVPPLPFNDPKQWVRMEMIQALRQAVKRGDQYFGMTAGQTQSPGIWPEHFGMRWEPSDKGGMNVSTRAGYEYDPVGGQTILNTLEKGLVGARSGGGSYPPGTVHYPMPTEGMTEAQLVGVKRKQDQILGDLASRSHKSVEQMRELIENSPEGKRSFLAKTQGMATHYDRTQPSVAEKVLKEAKSTGSGKGVQKFAKADYNMPIFEDLSTGQIMKPEGYTPEERRAELTDYVERARRAQQEILPEPEPQELPMGLTGAPDDWLEQLMAPQQQRLPLGRPDPTFREHPRSALSHLIEIDPELARAVLKGGFSYF